MAAVLALAFVSLIWGATFVLVKRALADVTPALYLALRFSLAATVLLLVFYGRMRRGISRRDLLAGFGTGTFLMLGYILQTAGLQTTTPSKSAFLTGLYIVLVPFVNSLVYRNRPRFLEMAGVIIAGLGMGLLSMQGESLSIARGDLLTIGCAVAFAVHIVLLGHWAPRVGFASLSVLQIASAAVVAGLAAPVVETPAIRWSTAVLGAILIGGVFATALAFVLQTWAQQRMTATRAAVIFSLEPVFAWIFSWLWEGEILTARAAIGAALILAGILLVELKPAPAAAHP
ncbi:MAG TPA: DMT family transporter [Bryobacteraceae bacterium]|nr:DMT family transporter [Bryobacteraceae bacterium]